MKQSVRVIKVTMRVTRGYRKWGILAKVRIRAGDSSENESDLEGQCTKVRTEWKCGSKCIREYMCEE
jgi:hypothetical protein